MGYFTLFRGKLKSCQPAIMKLLDDIVGFVLDKCHLTHPVRLRYGNNRIGDWHSIITVDQ